MAVSGRKKPDFHGSVSKGSAEDFDHSCEPCFAIGKYIEARGFCAECKEYLCKNCFLYHRRINATKHHILLDIDRMDQHTIQSTDSAVRMEKCQIHNNEVITFFCTHHEFLGCNDCITLNHKTCTIDYVPDICAGIGDSDEYRDIIKELDQKMKEMDVMFKKATQKDKEIDSSFDHAMNEIVKFRTEINDRLDQLQKQMQTEADKKKLTQKQTAKKVIETCTAALADIQKFKSSLQDRKSSQQNEQLYVLIKQAKSKLKSDDLKDSRESLDQTNIQYTFERNRKLEKFLTKQDCFGKLNLSTTLVKQEQTSQSTHPIKRKEAFVKLSHIEDINLSTKSDINKCQMTGCAVLSSNVAILADFNNKKLKVVNIQSKVVTEEKTLDSGPGDIAILPQNQVAVTMPEKKEIYIMKTTGKLSISRRISVKQQCRGITYHQDQLYVVCQDPKSVLIVDTQGNVNCNISLINEIFTSPGYILLSNDASHIYICSYFTNSVVSVTLQGYVSAVYKHKDLSRPRGMTMLDDGSLLVCCYNNKTIHHISGDLEQGHTILDGLQNPHSICYNHHKQEIYIGGGCDQLMIMKQH